MSTIIILDPNVLLAAAERPGHRESQVALQALARYREEFCLAYDPGKEIWRTYLDHYSHLVKHEKILPFIKFFVDRNQKRSIEIKDAILSETEKGWLRSKNCDVPVEPELVAVGHHARGDSAVLLIAGDYFSPSLSRRGTDDRSVLEQVQQRFTTTTFWPVREVNYFLSRTERARYPGSEEHLRQSLGLNPRENEFIEFKQPGNEKGEEVTALTENCLHKTFESICAMLNTSGGRVFVGVNDHGKIVGIDAELDEQGQPDDDLLSRRFTDRFHYFTPSINRFVKPGVIPLGNGRRVVVLHIARGEESTRYCYRKRTYDRNGPSNRPSEQCI